MAKDCCKIIQEGKTRLSYNIQQKTQFAAWNTDFLREFQSFALIHTFNMLVHKISWVILLLFLCQHGIVAAVICEGGIGILSCEYTSGTINIIKATYGRADRVTCAFWIPYYHTANTRCRRTVTNQVAYRCHGRKSCYLPAYNTIFGDPCVGTVKYLDLSYTCQP